MFYFLPKSVFTSSPLCVHCTQIPDALRKFSFHAFFPLKALNRKQVQLGLLLHQGDLWSFWSSLPIQKYTIKKERKEGKKGCGKSGGLKM